MIKKIFTLATLAFTACIINVQAQFKHHPELNKMDTKIEFLLDSAAKHMILFVLTKNSTDYDKAQFLVKQADSLNEVLERKAINEYKVTKIDSYILDRDEEIKTYANKDLKQQILIEKNGNEKVHFKLHTYIVGPKAKEWYEEFAQYLPKN